ncbi:hypothetical protein [Alsobacter soli]|uniref:hypothetical protein n=1 Tax=Alsobacter soli TaxID=2109933 RepID=UPI0013049226|nr:hypothetical protein [Alsobacter soli]
MRMVQEELALFDDSVFLLEPLPAAEAAAANIDLSTPGYRRRWTLAMRGER